MQRAETIVNQLVPEARAPKVASLVRSGPVASASSWKPTVEFGLEKLPLQQRVAQARYLSEQVPFSSHADWKPDPARPDPLELVMKTNAGRQEELIPIRMGRMAASAFSFLRGADAVMAWDLSKTPISGVNVMIAGDAHLKYLINLFMTYVMCLRLFSATLASMALRRDRSCGI